MSKQPYPKPQKPFLRPDLIPFNQIAAAITAAEKLNCAPRGRRFRRGFRPPACGVHPCEEDPKRSMWFDRDRLIYRKRHCPEKEERLKCRIPAPYGYRNSFLWPASRDMVWYANVPPYGTVTFEKAVQNWIRFEGDRFRFPGCGTTSPPQLPLSLGMASENH